MRGDRRAPTTANRAGMKRRNVGVHATSPYAWFDHIIAGWFASTGRTELHCAPSAFGDHTWVSSNVRISGLFWRRCPS
jgi:hypothetical protein